MMDSKTNIGGVQQRRRKPFWWFVCGGIIAIIVVISLAVFLKKQNQNNHDDDASNQNALRPAAGSGCQQKTVRITHICNVPDLDDDVFGWDDTMDIKILIQGELYWPQNVSSDCMDEYGSYEGSCVIPDTLLIGCFALNNSIDIPMSSISDRSTPPESLRVTIYDEDIISDDYINIDVPREQWYFRNECGQQELEASSTRKSAYIKMTVRSESTPEPTTSPSMIPSVSPSIDASTTLTRIPTVTTADTDPPSRPSTTTMCGVELASVGAGLANASALVDDMQRTLADYSNLDDGSEDDGRRRLFWNFLVSGVTAFATSFIGGAKDQGPLSTVADLCTIGSTFFTAFGGSGGDGGLDKQAQEEFFEEVLGRFDEIDSKLDSIQTQLQDGFEAIKLVIQEEFANQELDEWINVHLATLDSDYRAYLNPDHTAATRRVYEDIFRESCQQTHSPYKIVARLYSHTCKECDLLDGKSFQYLLDTFVALANSHFDQVSDRVRWFRQSFTRVIVGCILEATYLHSVCLYQPTTVCQNEDAEWSDRLEEMGLALQEVASSLSQAEERLKCYNKKVRITHICNLKDVSCKLPWQNLPAEKDPNHMDIEVELNDKEYWPKNTDQDCPSGSMYNSCRVRKSTIVNGCYALQNSAQHLFVSPKTLEVFVGDDCAWGLMTKERIQVPASSWYGSIYECGRKTIHPSAPDGSVKMVIESEPRG